MSPAQSQKSDFEPESPGRRIGMWAAYLRHRINQTLVEGPLRSLVETSGYLATGIIKVPGFIEEGDFEGEFPGFEIVGGYRFGALLLRGVSASPFPHLYISLGRYRAPILQTLASFNPHLASPDGYVAAHFMDDKECCGITAAHVTDKYRNGQRVPILCSACGDSARLKRRAPGLIDAAIVKFRCGCPRRNASSNIPPRVRSAIEGETVETHFGDTGKKLCTVMISLQTDAEIKCAAAPKHFLTDIHGQPGDSGSLVSEETTKRKEPDLIGMYLGEADCEDANLNVTYGYALDLKQAADLLGASSLQGEFNV